MSFERAERKLGEARTRLAYARPYYSTGVFALRAVVTPNVPSLAVDERWRLYANPGWVEAHDVGQVAVGLAHELQHLLFDHSARARSAGVGHSSMSLWNLAADADINDGLCADCATQRPLLPNLPSEWCVLPRSLQLPDDRVAEWYFAELLKLNRDANCAGAGDVEGGGRGRSGPGSSGNARRDPFGCGSGSTSIPAPWDVGSPETSGIDGLDDADAWDVRRRVAQDIRDHTALKGRGSVPLGVLLWSDELLRPERISWNSALMGSIRRASYTTAGAVRHSYARTSRRQHAFHPVIMPAYRRPVPSVAFVTDTSSSMEAAQRALVRGVVDDACRQLGVPLRVIDVDAVAHRDTMVTSGKLAMKVGGGGTDMRVGIERAMRRPRADCIVVCTDCATPWPDAVPPGVSVVVVAIGADEESLSAVPRWATTIVAEVAS